MQRCYVYSYVSVKIEENGSNAAGGGKTRQIRYHFRQTGAPFQEQQVSVLVGTEQRCKNIKIPSVSAKTTLAHNAVPNASIHAFLPPSCNPIVYVRKSTHFSRHLIASLQCPPPLSPADVAGVAGVAGVAASAATIRRPALTCGATAVFRGWVDSIPHVEQLKIVERNRKQQKDGKKGCFTADRGSMAGPGLGSSLHVGTGNFILRTAAGRTNPQPFVQTPNSGAAFRMQPESNKKPRGLIRFKLEK